MGTLIVGLVIIHIFLMEIINLAQHSVKNICLHFASCLLLLFFMPHMAVRPPYNVQAKRVTFLEKDRLYIDLKHWADIKHFFSRGTYDFPRGTYMR
jgi:hypothetical protein